MPFIVNTTMLMTVLLYKDSKNILVTYYVSDIHVIEENIRIEMYHSLLILLCRCGAVAHSGIATVLPFLLSQVRSLLVIVK